MASETKKTFEKINEILSTNTSKEQFEKLWKKIYAEEIKGMMVAYSIKFHEAGRPYPFDKWKSAFSYDVATRKLTFNAKAYLNIILRVAEIAQQNEMESCLLKLYPVAFDFDYRVGAINEKTETEFEVSVGMLYSIFGYSDQEQLENFFQMLMKLRKLLKPTPATESKASPPAEAISATPEQAYIDLLPSTPPPSHLLVSDRPGGEVRSCPIDDFLSEHKRTWLNGLRVHSADIHRIERMKDYKGEDYSNFTLVDHKKWAEWMEKVVICFMGEEMGYGVFVAPGCTIPKGTVIPAGGVLDFNLEHGFIGPNRNTHAAAFSNPSSPPLPATALVDPLHSGNIWDLINHGFMPTTVTRIKCWNFGSPAIEGRVQPAKLGLPLEPKVYKGIFFSTFEVEEDIHEGEQLLARYFEPFLYYNSEGTPNPGTKFYLFDRNGGLIGPEKFSPRMTTFFARQGEKTYSGRIFNWFLLCKRISTIDLKHQDTNGNIYILKVPHEICLEAARKEPEATVVNLTLNPPVKPPKPLPTTFSKEAKITYPPLIPIKDYQAHKAELGKELRNLANRTDISPQEFKDRLNKILEVDPLVIDEAGRSSGTPLQCAAKKGNIDQIEALLARGAKKPSLDGLMALLPKDRPDLLDRLKGLAAKKTDAAVLGASLSASFSSAVPAKKIDPIQTSEVTSNNTSGSPSPT